ncbi:MAG: hypothetical protein R3C59_20435 [Planctomycetaceae bacterium]
MSARRWIFKLSFTTVMAVAGFVASEATANASCGDYLHTRHSRPMPSNESQPVDSPDSREISEQQPEPHQPCSGPGCHRRNGDHPAPFAPGSSRISTTSEALLACCHAAGSPDMESLIVSDVACERRGFPERPLKPPRTERTFA